MIALRALKAVTVCAFLNLILTAWVFHFDPHGYNRTLDSLRASFGDGAYLLIAIFSVVGVISMPIFGLIGIVGMALSRQLGRSALVLGFLCCALTATDLLLWKKYGGMPSGNGATGPTPVTRKAAPPPPRRDPAKAPHQ
jgi:hypothetical protein